MAIDSRDKRASAINIALPFRGILPNPDASVDAADRPVLAFMYAADTVDGGGSSTTSTMTRRIRLTWSRY